VKSKIDSTFLEHATTYKLPCREPKPDLYFGDSQDEEERYNDEEAHEVAALCATCPLKFPCLEWALLNDEHGVWGGMTRSQRQQLKDRGKR